MKKIVVYTMKNGKQPFLEWMINLRKKDKNNYLRIWDRIGRIEKFDYFGDYKSVGEGIKELRFTFGSGYRVYYGEFGDQIVLLLCGGDKKTQEEDIKNAKLFWKDFKTNE